MEIPNTMGRDIRLPPKLWEEIQALAYSIKEEDLDLLFVIDGLEGSTKTQTSWTIGAAFAAALGSPFGVENIHYSTQEYMESSDKMGRYTVHTLDEAGVILDRSNGNTREAKRFTRYLQVGREGNNQVHIIVLPAYHLLNGYVVNWRSRFIMHMFSVKEKTDDPRVPGGFKTKKGGFKIWTKCDAITYNYFLAQEKHIFKYPTINPFLMDWIPNCKVFSEEERQKLRDKKFKWRSEYIEDKPKDTAGAKKARAGLIKSVDLLINKSGWKPDDVAKYIGVSLVQVYRYLKEIKESSSEKVDELPNE
jgi:hypothetical protein